MKARRGSRSRYSCTPSLTSALRGVGSQCHDPAALPPGNKPGSHCTGRWVDSRAGLNGCGKSRPRGASTPPPPQPCRSSSPSESVIEYAIRPTVNQSKIMLWNNLHWKLSTFKSLIDCNGKEFLNFKFRISSEGKNVINLTWQVWFKWRRRALVFKTFSGERGGDTSSWFGTTW
jgi:hypothetical protein